MTAIPDLAKGINDKRQEYALLMDVRRTFDKVSREKGTDPTQPCDKHP